MCISDVDVAIISSSCHMMFMLFIMAVAMAIDTPAVDLEIRKLMNTPPVT